MHVNQHITFYIAQINTEFAMHIECIFRRDRVFDSQSELRVRLARREAGFDPLVKCFNDRSRAVLLLWYICVVSV